MKNLMKIGVFINELAMMSQECTQKQTQIVNEILLIITTALIRFLHVS